MRIRFYTFLLWLSLMLFAATGFGQLGSSGMQTISIKKGSAVALRANSEGANSYVWYKNGVLIRSYNRQTLVTSSEGIYRVASLYTLGCSSDLSEEIKVIIQGQLTADVAITKRSESKMVMSDQIFEYYLNVRNNGEDDATNVNVRDVLPDNLVFESLVNPVDGLASYDETNRSINWKIPVLTNQRFSELVVKVRAKQAGLVTNTATVKATEFDPDLQNNTSTDHKTITGIKIPSVFTPNGDGKNDTFYMENLNLYDQNEVTVINRWGSTVFQSKGYLNDWTAQGLSDGTYFYVVRVKKGNSEWLDYKGYVTVIR